MPGLDDDDDAGGEGEAGLTCSRMQTTTTTWQQRRPALWLCVCGLCGAGWRVIACVRNGQRHKETQSSSRSSPTSQRARVVPHRRSHSHKSKTHPPHTTHRTGNVITGWRTRATTTTSAGIKSRGQNASVEGARTNTLPTAAVCLPRPFHTTPNHGSRPQRRTAHLAGRLVQALQGRGGWLHLCPGPFRLSMHARPCLHLGCPSPR